MRIVAEGLRVRLGGALILDNVGFSVAPGQYGGLIGPNGAGKSTLLRVLAGLLAPEAGTVRYDGRPLREIGRGALARQVAFLAQGGEVNWPMQAREIVALGRLPHRGLAAGDAGADAAAVDRALAAAGIAHLADRTASTLSGGERMRVLLARALAVEAAILLADEPTAALDPLHQLRVMQLLRDAARGGTGVVVVLHDLALAARFCDRLVLMRDGRIVEDGVPSDVLTDAHIRTAYGVTVLRGEHEGVPYLLPWSPASTDEDHP